jgi:hypothetical protein
MTVVIRNFSLIFDVAEYEYESMRNRNITKFEIVEEQANGELEHFKQL